MIDEGAFFGGGLYRDLDRIAGFALRENLIINGVYKDPHYNDEPKVFIYGAKFKSKWNDNHNIASGFSFNKELALIKVLGEALERYSLDVYKSHIAIVGTISQINKLGRYLDPQNVSPFSKKQLKQKKYGKFIIKKNSRFAWSTGTLLNNNEEILIPSQLISFNHTLIKGEPEILPINSTGTAFGLNFDDALYRSICEIIERDAFMISYLNKLPSPKIDLLSLKDNKINKILKILERYKLDLFVLDLTTDIGVPVFGSLVIDRTGYGPAVSVGLKAGWETRNCIIGAIEESLMSRNWIRDNSSKINYELERIKEIETVEQRAFSWFSTQTIQKLDFWLKNKKVIKVNIKETENNKLDKTLKLLMQNNISIIYKDIAPKVIKKAGFFVIRCLIPELQPLYLDETYVFLGNKRLYNVPSKLGFIGRNESDLNKIPHPFL